MAREITKSKIIEYVEYLRAKLMKNSLIFEVDTFDRINISLKMLKTSAESNDDEVSLIKIKWKLDNIHSECSSIAHHYNLNKF